MNALQVVSEPRRSRILQLVWRRELSAGEIAHAFTCTFGAVSQHLRVLHDHDFVQVRSSGRFRYYRAKREALGLLAPVLEQMWADKLDALNDLMKSEGATHE